MEKRTLF